MRLNSSFKLQPTLRASCPQVSMEFFETEKLTKISPMTRSSINSQLSTLEQDPESRIGLCSARTKKLHEDLLIGSVTYTMSNPSPIKDHKIDENIFEKICYPLCLSDHDHGNILVLIIKAVTLTRLEVFKKISTSRSYIFPEV